MKKSTFGVILLGLAVVANLSYWTGIFLLTKNMPLWVYDVISYLGIASGFANGLVITSGLALIFHSVAGLQMFHHKSVGEKGNKKIRTIPNMRFWIPSMGGIIIFGISLYVLPPYILSIISDDFKSNLSNPTLWATLRVLVADLIVVAVASVDNKTIGLLVTEQKTERKPKNTKPRPKQTKYEAKCKFGCNWSKEYETERGMINGSNSHNGKCKKNPANQFAEMAKVKE